MSLVKLIVVQVTHEPLGIGNSIPPQLVLNISHGKLGKRELWKIHRNPQCIRTHQLATYPLSQVEDLQANTLQRLGDPRSNDGLPNQGPKQKEHLPKDSIQPVATHRVRKSTLGNMQTKIIRESRISTHPIKRKVIEMSLDQRKAPQVHPHTTSNEIVFHGLMLKKEGTVCKMTVCKIDKVQFAR